LVKRFFDEVPPNGASGEPPAPPKEPPSPSPREQPPSSNGSKSGTGFYVSNDGYLITNEHVVNSCNTVKVVDAAGEGTVARIARSSKLDDLALLKTGEGLKLLENWSSKTAAITVSGAPSAAAHRTDALSRTTPKALVLAGT
jgi:S1-C subfamily serine protease